MCHTIFGDIKLETQKYSVDIHKFTFVFSLWKESKFIESFCFHIWKGTPTEDIPTEDIYSIEYDEHYENGFSITPGNSFLIQ